MGLPFEPEAIEALHARYLAAVAELIPIADVREGRRPAPSSERAHVFDTRLGLRLIISREQDLAGRVACTLAGVRLVAAYAQEVLEVKRLADARAELPIILQIITLESRNMVTTVSSDDRIAVLRGAARTYPLYAYALTFDAFVHNADGQTATKSDALLTHLGTRDGDRHILQRRYTVDGARVTMQPETDLDCRQVETPTGERCTVTDPYAWVFVSVPTPARPQ